MAQPALFKPIRVRNLELSNRIVIAPMCQYSAEDGEMNDWHLMHLGQLANSGAALLTIEASAVRPEGRITWADVGLYDDATEAAMRRSAGRRAQVVGHADRHPAQPCRPQGVYRAAMGRWWTDRPRRRSGWQTVAPSAVAFLDGDNPPTALDRAGLARIRDAFAAAQFARRGLASMSCRCTRRTAICCISSSRRSPTSATDEYGG